MEYILRTISANDVGANVDMSPGLGLAHSKRTKIPISGVTYELLNVRFTIGTSLGIKLDRIHRILLYHPIMHDISVDNNVVSGKCRFGTLFPCGLGYTFFSDTFNNVVVLVRKGFEIY